MSTHLLRFLVVGALVAGTAACGDEPTALVGDNQQPRGLCDLAEDLTAQGAFPDAIPALTEPAFIDAEAAHYLVDSDRVLGLVVDGEARAYPHNILWWHEVVNDRFGERWISVSYCPLTGSGLAMDATINGSRVEFGVSGLLFANNLVLFDRLSEDLFGPQLSATGKCQSFANAVLDLHPVREMSWGDWKELYPLTRVLSDDTGYTRNYRQYPYGSYEELSNSDLLFPQTPDETRPIKERVLGIRTGEFSGRGYPLGELASRGRTVALNEDVDGAVVIFYSADNGESAVAYRRRVGGQTLTFEVDGEMWRDLETGTTWNLAGAAVEGPLAPARLAPVAEAYVVFWFAWKQFQPDAEIWLAN